MKIETPCIGICSTVYGDDICRGCRRFSDEIVEWNGMNDQQKLAILDRLNHITETVMRDKVAAIDEVLLKSKLDELGIRYRATHSPYCWVHALFRGYGFKIKNPEDYGVTLLPSQKGVPIKALLETIDEELYSLSEAALIRRDDQ